MILLQLLGLFLEHKHEGGKGKNLEWPGHLEPKAPMQTLKSQGKRHQEAEGRIQPLLRHTNPPGTL